MNEERRARQLEPLQWETHGDLPWQWVLAALSMHALAVGKTGS